jgi:protein SCO1/2
MLGLGAAALALAGGVLLAFANVDTRRVPDELHAVVVAKPVKLEAVQLTDHRGRSLTVDWFAGHWTFVFFGFTNCHDVCPATLAQMAAIQAAFAGRFPDAVPPRYLFVGVDPARDSQARLAAFVGGFGSAFIGATGEVAQIEALERPLAAYHRIGTPGVAGDYRVVHSAELFLIDPAGRVYARFVPPVDPALAARQLHLIMSRYAQEAGVHAAS